MLIRTRCIDDGSDEPMKVIFLELGERGKVWDLEMKYRCFHSSFVYSSSQSVTFWYFWCGY